MKNLLKRLWRDEGGENLVEYVLLAVFLGLACWGGFLVIQGSIASSYGDWDTGQQDLWEPPDPVAFGS